MIVKYNEGKANSFCKAQRLSISSTIVFSPPCDAPHATSTHTTLPETPNTI